MSRADLTLISTDDLVDEILARADHGIYISVRERDKVYLDELLRYKGSRYMCLALCARMADAMNAEIENTGKDVIER